MKLKTGAFAAAAGIVAAAVSAICAAFVAIAPDSATALASAVIHLDLTGLARPVTLGTFVGGVVFWGLGMAVVFGVAAAIYDRLAGTGGTAQPGPAIGAHRDH
jgi:hypothetical protein